MAGAAPLATDRLVAYYEEADARMRDLPFYNPALAVEALGFRDWEGHRLGVLITPWFMNLILMPGDGDDWSGVEQGDQSDWHLPAETIRFTANRLDQGEVFLTAPLFTSVTGVADHELARSIAAQVMDGLMAEPGSEKAPPGRAVSRRDLFRGKLRSSD